MKKRELWVLLIDIIISVVVFIVLNKIVGFLLLGIIFVITMCALIETEYEKRRAQRRVNELITYITHMSEPNESENTSDTVISHDCGNDRCVKKHIEKKSIKKTDPLKYGRINLYLDTHLFTCKPSTTDVQVIYSNYTRRMRWAFDKAAYSKKYDFETDIGAQSGGQPYYSKIDVPMGYVYVFPGASLTETSYLSNSGNETLGERDYEDYRLCPKIFNPLGPLMAAINIVGSKFVHRSENLDNRVNKYNVEVIYFCHIWGSTHAYVQMIDSTLGGLMTYNQLCDNTAFTYYEIKPDVTTSKTCCLFSEIWNGIQFVINTSRNNSDIIIIIDSLSEYYIKRDGCLPQHINVCDTIKQLRDLAQATGITILVGTEVRDDLFKLVYEDKIEYVEIAPNIITRI